MQNNGHSWLPGNSVTGMPGAILSNLFLILVMLAKAVLL